jgi:hypothetical protein
MAWDVAIDLVTGDLVWTGVNDFGSRDGSALDKQRIHVRLFVERGEFIYDPTNGALGSRLLDILRLPRQRALNEAELYIREALEPMDDIEVVNVGVEEVVVPTHQSTTVSRTNAVRNPSFENTINGYAAYQNGINGTIARVIDIPAFAGKACCKITATSGTGSLGVVTLAPLAGIPVVPGEVWTVTSHTRAETVARSAGVVAGFHDASNNFLTAISGSYAANQVGAWIRNRDLTFTVPQTPSGIAKMTLYTDLNAVAVGESHHVDGLMAVKGTSAGYYFDGDSSNADWLGLPNDSPSLLADTIPQTVDQRMIRLSISYHPRFDNSDIATPPETTLESFAIDVPA